MISLPIEINIPKRFVNEGNCNILHWRGAKEKEKYFVLILSSCCGSERK